jgi:ribosomal protein L21E
LATANADIASSFAKGGAAARFNGRTGQTFGLHGE